MYAQVSEFFEKTQAVDQAEGHDRHEMSVSSRRSKRKQSTMVESLDMAKNMAKNMANMQSFSQSVQSSSRGSHGHSMVRATTRFRYSIQHPHINSASQAPCLTLLQLHYPQVRVLIPTSGRAGIPAVLSPRTSTKLWPTFEMHRLEFLKSEPGRKLLILIRDDFLCRCSWTSKACSSRQPA